MKVMFFAKILDIYTNDHKSFLSKLMFGVKVEYSVLHACCLVRRKKNGFMVPKNHDFRETTHKDCYIQFLTLCHILHNCSSL